MTICLRSPRRHNMSSPAASTISLAPLSFPIFKGQRCQLHCSLAMCSWNRARSDTRTLRLRTMAQFSELPEVWMHVRNAREKLWKFVPSPVKDFPWKKAEGTMLKQLVLAEQEALKWLLKLWEFVPSSVKEFPWKETEDIMLKQLVLVAQEALKWSLLALYVWSSVSDVLYSIYGNKELIIPLGLFVGCMLTNFLMETSRELFPISEERSQSWHLVRIGGFFAFIKVISYIFTLRGRIFLLHAANGGLMQAMWLWKSSTEKEDMDSSDDSIKEDASITA